MFNKSSLITVLLFITAGWFLFTYRILDVPPGINGDEAAIGFNAALVSRSGYDSNKRFLPLFTAAKGSNDWKQPVTFYFEAAAFRIFGPSYFTLRAVSVFFVLISGAIIFFLVKELFDIKTAVWGLIVFATTPIVMISSHLALENIAPVPFIALWLWMMVKYGKDAKIRYLVLAAVSLGFGIYSYLGLRLIVPPLAALSSAYILYLGRKSIKTAVCRIFIFLLFFIPFLAVILAIKNQYPGSFFGQYRPYKIASYQQLVLPYVSSFDPSFLFIRGDVTPYHSTGSQGVFLLAGLPLFVAGIVRILQGKQPIQIFILLAFFLMPVLYGLASDIHRGSRLLSLIPPYTAISAIGMMVLTGLRKKIWRLILIPTVVILIFSNFADFLNDYWYQYPGRVKSEFSKPYHLVYDKAYNLGKLNNLNIFIQDDFRKQNQIAQDFFEQVYFPGGLKLWNSNQPVPENSIVIVSDYILSQKKNINREEVTGDFGILINRTKK